MRGRLVMMVAVALGLLAGSCTWNNNDRGTAGEAQALVDKAIARFQEAGPEAAFAEINDRKGRFVDRDLYIFVIGPDKIIAAHGADAARIGMNVMELKDVDGKLYGPELAAAPAEGAWVDYKFKNPVSGEVEPKSSWVKSVDGYVFGCGYYKP